MRKTYAIILESSVDWLLPGFFDSISGYEFAKGIDRTAFRQRMEFCRVEVENVEPTEEISVLQTMQRIGESLAEKFFRLDGRPDWRDFSKVTIQEVTNLPADKFEHPLEGTNNSQRCKICGCSMRKVKGQNGLPDFWSCDAFPECRSTKEIAG